MDIAASDVVAHEADKGGGANVVDKGFGDSFGLSAVLARLRLAASVSGLADHLLQAQERWMDGPVRDGLGEAQVAEGAPCCMDIGLDFGARCPCPTCSGSELPPVSSVGKTTVHRTVV